MRAHLLIACAALALAGCGKSSQSDGTLNADDNLTAASIVSNDVTAIDAVTGDAANMAADVDMNFGGVAENGSTATSNEASPSSPKRSANKPSTATDTNSTAATTANATTNGQ